MAPGQNHPLGDRKIVSGDCIRVVWRPSETALGKRVNDEQPMVLFRDLEATWYVPAVDLRDCGDKVRILSSRQQDASAVFVQEWQHQFFKAITGPSGVTNRQNPPGR
ncbi:unnamed protein product [Cladocopium goreaui]|uniref:BTB domain-containing protein n=1 Tax=Cladocopium goreaui TaxID=2562237 RepID=A0A9P1CKK5_9DINO|nr:unnamed protein product [Cladocopium goreaui]